MLDPENVVISVSNTRTDDCPAEAVVQAVLKKRCQLHITDAVRMGSGRSAIHESVHFELAAERKGEQSA